MEKVAVIICNWNGKKFLSQCLKSLSIQSYGNGNQQIFFVDNGSSDGSVGYVKLHFPKVRIIRNESNLGFAQACNIGMKAAISEGIKYLWLLNNDTVAENKCMENLVASAKEIILPSIIGHKILFYPGCEYHHERYSNKEVGKVIWYAGGIIDWSNMYCSHRGVDEVDRGLYEKREVTGFVSGCSFFMTAAVVKLVGYFDTRYYMYLEDFDYCQRARKKGIKLYYDPKPVVWHKNAGSSGGPGSIYHQYYQTKRR